MKEFKINPFNVIGSRRTECLFPHMSVVTLGVDMYTKMDCIQWVENNLKGRYWFGSLVKLIDNRTVIYNAVAFEDPYESTLFILGCPDVAKSKV